MKFGDLFLVHIGLPVDSALVAELLREKQIKEKKKRNGFRWSSDPIRE